MADTLLLKLLFVHFTADYLLQFGFLAEGKERHGLRSWHIWVHIALHGILVHLVLQTWWITLVTLTTHAVIDVGKVKLSGSGLNRFWFFLDQALHLSVVGVIWWIGRSDAFPGLPEWFEANLALITGLVVLSKPSKYMIGVYLTGWVAPSMPKATPFCDKGPVIGMAERMGTLLLVTWTGWWIPAVYAAGKIIFSVAGPFKVEDPDRRRYALVGSLISLSLAWMVALLVVFQS